MSNEKAPALKIDFNVACDGYDLANRKPLDDIRIGINVEDGTDGTKRKFDATVKPGSRVDDGWGVLANRLLDVVDNMTSVMDPDYFETENWSYSRHGMKSNNKNVDVDWLAEGMWVGLRTPVQDINAEQPEVHLFITGYADLILPEADVATLMSIPPCEWWLPDYRPEDWMAHKGFFSSSSFDEKNREWTREKILRGLKVAETEMAHFRNMARIYEERTGCPIGDE